MSEKEKVNLWDEYETNPDAEVNGVWITDFRPGIDIKLAKLGNKEHTKFVENLRKPYAKLIRCGGTIPEEKADEIGIKSLAKTILLDWKGVTDKEGNDLPYSVENAEMLLTKMPLVKERITVLAFDKDNILFNAKALEEEGKKSSNASSGNSKSAKTQSG